MGNAHWSSLEPQNCKLKSKTETTATGLKRLKSIGEAVFMSAHSHPLNHWSKEYSRSFWEDTIKSTWTSDKRVRDVSVEDNQHVLDSWTRICGTNLEKCFGEGHNINLRIRKI